MIEFKIDYAQFSFMARVVMDIETGEDFHKPSNLRFYKSMTRYKSGLVVYDGNPNTEKRLAVMSGKTCENMGVDVAFINKSREWGAKYSRLDLAMTTTREILPLIKKDHKKVVSEKFSEGKQIANFEDYPETLIFGDMSKRSKKGMVRCYDKALQMGLDGVMLHRIEVENRRNDAEIAAKRLGGGATMASVMNSRWRVDTDWYRDMMTDEIATQRFSPDEPVEVTEIEKKMAWLMKQVVPSMKYVIEYDKSNGTHNFKLLMKRLGMDYQGFDNT